MKLKSKRKRIIKMAFNRTLKGIKFDSETEKWSFVDDFQELFNEYLEEEQQVILNEVFTEISSERESLLQLETQTETIDENGKD